MIGLIIVLMRVSLIGLLKLPRSLNVLNGIKIIRLRKDEGYQSASIDEYEQVNGSTTRIEQKRCGRAGAMNVLKNIMDNRSACEQVT